MPVIGFPIGILVVKHRKGMTFVSGLGTAIETHAKEGPSARKILLDNLRGLMDLYPNHSWKEDIFCRPMTNKMLNSHEQRELQEKIETVEEDTESDVHHN